jgi:Leucine-rich repeat (LRR) protein
METDALAFTCNWANVHGTPLATDWGYHGMSGLPVTTEENPEGRRTLRNNASRTHRLLSRDELENGKQARWLELEVHGKYLFIDLAILVLGKVRNLNGFFEMRHLTALFASHNAIQKISPKISQLSNLTLLDLSFNQIALLPPEIGDMGSLTHLNISNNQLKSLPSEMGKLFRLKSLSKYRIYGPFISLFLDISNNPLPNEILMKAHGVSGTSSVLQHLLDKLASKSLLILWG